MDGISEEVVEACLSRLGHNFPDPQLVIVFCPGRVMSLFEFPPWRTSSCEILHGGRLGHLSLSVLRRLLQRFAGTEQRFGT